MIALFAGLALLVSAAVAAVVLREHRRTALVFASLVVAGCAMAIVPAIGVLASGHAVHVAFHYNLPGGDWVFGIDPLSAVFLVALFSVGSVAAVYGTGYMALGRTAAWPCHAVFALELAALALVLSAQAVVPFMAAWELMAIGSLLLILTEYRVAEARRAGLIYIVATHVGTLALFALFALLARTGNDWSFRALATAATSPDGADYRNAVLGLSLVAFGIKAGLFPLHFWLPPAHAAAPSHVSALLSGVVIKIGIYGLLRVITLLGGAPAWWGWCVLAIGLGSAVLGVLWALAQHDIKRLLAYHSVENIGIILMGLGAGALGAAYGHPLVATLGYAAALLHTLNHALFKSLLFLGAGTVYRITGTRNLEQLGGLARAVPLTWLGFLVGSIAIIGVPPLNGFVSEWLVFQALFRAGHANDALRLAILVMPGLALAGGLALACFAKVGGVVFLGTPRAPRELTKSPQLGTLEIAPLALAGACAFIGLLPFVVLPAMLGAGAFVAGIQLPSVEARATATMVGGTAITIAAITLSLLALAIWFISRGLRRNAPVRLSQTWSCGYAAVTARMQYTASSFAAPLVDLFGRLSGVRVHKGASVFHSEPVDLVLDRAVSPWWNVIVRLALRLRPLQQGRLSRYLVYVIGTVVALLTYLVVRAGGVPK
ncbi:MAG TPA: proton-conducting transporter membrane subunit [Gemmatimonadaceae bacterium]|nr:proton-conducting transporter membrane subunit [Gemmatimonadaceae bacterium]